MRDKLDTGCGTVITKFDNKIFHKLTEGWSYLVLGYTNSVSNCRQCIAIWPLRMKVLLTTVVGFRKNVKEINTNKQKKSNYSLLTLFYKNNLILGDKLCLIAVIKINSFYKN